MFKTEFLIHFKLNIDEGSVTKNLNVWWWITGYKNFPISWLQHLTF